MQFNLKKFLSKPISLWACINNNEGPDEGQVPPSMESRMKYIIVEENDMTSDIVEDLCSIELTQDAVIVCPLHEEMDDDFAFETDDFILRNRKALTPDRNNIYTFYPRMKMSLPVGLTMSTYCRIPGLAITQQTVDKTRGMEFENWEPFDGKDPLKLNFTALKGEYTLYSNMTYYLKEFNRQAFLNHLGTRHSGIRIRERSDILGMLINECFLGGPRNFFNELYIIRSDYIYKRFPDF